MKQGFFSYCHSLQILLLGKSCSSLVSKSGNEATGTDAKNSGVFESEMDGRAHTPSLLNVLLSRNRVMQVSYLVSMQINIQKGICKCLVLEGLRKVSYGNQ